MAAKGPIRGDLWQANSILNAVAAVSSVSVAAVMRSPGRLPGGNQGDWWREPPEKWEKHRDFDRQTSGCMVSRCLKVHQVTSCYKIPFRP